MDNEYILLDVVKFQNALRMSVPANTTTTYGSLDCAVNNSIQAAFHDFVQMLSDNIETCKIPADEFIIVKIGDK